jgi:hypothetical protein
MEASTLGRLPRTFAFISGTRTHRDLPNSVVADCTFDVGACVPIRARLLRIRYPGDLALRRFSGRSTNVEASYEMSPAGWMGVRPSAGGKSFERKEQGGHSKPFKINGIFVG